MTFPSSGNLSVQPNQDHRARGIVGEGEIYGKTTFNVVRGESYARREELRSPVREHRLSRLETSFRQSVRGNGGEEAPARSATTE